MGDIIEVARKDGATSFKVRIRRKGQRLQTKTFKRKTDAKKWMQLVEGKLVEGKDLPRTYRHTVAEAIEKYFKEVLPGKKLSTQSVQRQKLEYWSERIGHFRLPDLNSEFLEKEKVLLLTSPVLRKGQKPSKRGPAAVNRYFAVLRHLLNKCKRWKWCEYNVAVEIDFLSEPKGRERTLSDAEMKKILNGLELCPREDFRLIVLIALTTGCRRGNAQSLRWQDIDFEKLTINFPDTKNNEALTLPITVELADALRNRREREASNSIYAFPSASGSANPAVDVKKLWRKFATELGFVDLHFHDLRHAVASYLASNSVPLFTIARMLGHKSLESTKRYAHMAVNDIMAQTEMLGARLKRVK